MFSRVLNKKAVFVGAAGAIAGTAFYYNQSSRHKLKAPVTAEAPAAAKKQQHSKYVERVAKCNPSKGYQEVYNEIAVKLRDDDEYDNYTGYGPVLLRLAWHSAGTWDKSDNSGGSYGGTYRFDKEAKDPSNTGLENAARFLEPIRKTYDWISHGDLYTLAGVVAVQEMQGPKIPWRPGRVDQDEEQVPENGRLPDASENAPYIREFFKRLNFNDRETVALLGAHAVGKTHLKNSGYEGPWGPSPNVFNNAFFVNLLNEEWKKAKNAAGNEQYNNDKGWMMLPTDMALVQDSKFRTIVEEYAADQDAFFKGFASAFNKLLENGITYPNNLKTIYFKTLDEQEEEQERQQSKPK